MNESKTTLECAAELLGTYLEGTKDLQREIEIISAGFATGVVVREQTEEKKGA